MCEPAGGEPPGTALTPDERITNALDEDLIERDIQARHVAAQLGQGVRREWCAFRGAQSGEALRGVAQGQPERAYRWNSLPGWVTQSVAAGERILYVFLLTVIAHA